MLARHAKPLEKGAIANGLSSARKVDVEYYRHQPSSAVIPRQDKLASVPSLKSTDNCTTIKVEDAEMIQVKRELATRTGQAWNKGGIQLLTELDIQEQRTGAHRRRS